MKICEEAISETISESSVSAPTSSQGIAPFVGRGEVIQFPDEKQREERKSQSKQTKSKTSSKQPKKQKIKSEKKKKLRRYQKKKQPLKARN